MSDKPVLPPNVVLLGEALRPLWLKLTEQMDAPVNPTRDMPVMSEFISRHLDKVADTAERLADIAVIKLNGVVMNTAVKEADVYRAVGGLETYLDELSAGYFEVRSLRAFGSDIEARDLLAGTYRHLLSEIRAWLGDICETIADPVASLKKRGLPASGNVELVLALEMTSPSQVHELTLWIKRQQPFFYGIQAQVPERTVTKEASAAKKNIGFMEHKKAMQAEVKSNRVRQQRQPEKTRRRVSRPAPRRNRVSQQRQLEETRQEESFLATVVAVTLGIGLGSLLFGDDCDLDI